LPRSRCRIVFAFACLALSVLWTSSSQAGRTEFSWPDSYVPGRLAGAPLSLPPDVSFMDISPYLSILDDTEGNLDIETVSGPDFAGQFRPMDREWLQNDMKPAYYWLRFDLILQPGGFNNSSRFLGVYDYFFEMFEVYLPNPNSDDWRKLSLAGSPSRYPPLSILPLGALAVGETLRVYVRIRTSNRDLPSLALVDYEAYHSLGAAQLAADHGAVLLHLAADLVLDARLAGHGVFGSSATDSGAGGAQDAPQAQEPNGNGVSGHGPPLPCCVHACRGISARTNVKCAQGVG